MPADTLQSLEKREQRPRSAPREGPFDELRLLEITRWEAAGYGCTQTLDGHFLKERALNFTKRGSLKISDPFKHRH